MIKLLLILCYCFFISKGVPNVGNSQKLLSSVKSAMNDWLTDPQKTGLVANLETEMEIANGHEAMKVLVQNLTYMGNTAFSIMMQHGYPVMTAEKCIGEKSQIANQIVQIKMENIAKCNTSEDTFGIIKKLSAKISSTPKSEVIRNCVRKVFDSAVYEFGKVYDALLKLCLQPVFFMKKDEDGKTYLPKPPHE